MRNMLGNDAYISMVEFRGESYKGIYKPIVRRELYDAAQDISKSLSR